MEIFEETIDAPMGRRLANSSCDEEEYLLNSLELDFTGYSKRKNLKMLSKNVGKYTGGFSTIGPT